MVGGTALKSVSGAQSEGAEGAAREALESPIDRKSRNNHIDRMNENLLIIRLLALQSHLITYSTHCGDHHFGAIQACRTLSADLIA